MQQKTILAINGSTRAKSTNLYLIHIIQQWIKPRMNLNLFRGVDTLPQFNPDLDQDDPPDSVIDFRNQLKTADGILICTPEYAMGVPGSLKNAIDWTVSSCEFSNKPTALITASLSGEKGHASLIETLKMIEAKVTDKTQLVISFAKTKINADHINEPETEKAVISLLNDFEDLMLQDSVGNALKK